MKYFLSLILALMLSFNFIYFKRISEKKPRFKKLEQCLLPFKKIVNPKGHIAFNSNSNLTENHYFTQFILAPTVFDNDGDEDTIMYLKDLKFNNLNETHYFKNKKIIFSFKNDGYHAFILIKK